MSAAVRRDEIPVRLRARSFGAVTAVGVKPRVAFRDLRLGVDPWPRGIEALEDTKLRDTYEDMSMAAEGVPAAARAVVDRAERETNDALRALLQGSISNRQATTRLQQTCSALWRDHDVFNPLRRRRSASLLDEPLAESLKLDTRVPSEERRIDRRLDRRLDRERVEHVVVAPERGARLLQARSGLAL